MTAWAKARGASWEIVADPSRDVPVLIFTGESFGVGGGVWVGSTIGIPFKGDRRRLNDGRLGEPFFVAVVFGLALREPEAPAIVVNDDGDVIGVVERSGAAIEGRVIEGPFRRC